MNSKFEKLSLKCFLAIFPVFAEISLICSLSKNRCNQSV